MCKELEEEAENVVTSSQGKAKTYEGDADPEGGGDYEGKPDIVAVQLEILQEQVYARSDED